MPLGRGDAEKEVTRTDSASSNDSIKDARKNELSNFLDNQTLRTSPFGDNISGEHVYRRAERIAAAAHLITSHIGQSEPARDMARAKSLNLLHLSLLLRSELRTTGSENVRNMQAAIRELISLIRILGISGRVSHQNTNILVDALDELGSLLTTSQRSGLSETVALSREDLIPRIELPPRRLTVVPQKRATRSHKSPSRGLPMNALKDTNVKDDTEDTTRSTESRTMRIMDLLKGGGLLGIKDISSNLPEYSEKMIQRDLALLVNRNRVKKLGAKRWSRYTLVQ